MRITKCQGEGQGSCTMCSSHGWWNRHWMTCLSKIEGFDGCYCSDCVEIIRNAPVLKIASAYFEDVIYGRKKAECRLNDRDFRVGQIYSLSEFDGCFTGRSVTICITHVLDRFKGLKKGWCVFSFEILGKDV